MACEPAKAEKDYEIELKRDENYSFTDSEISGSSAAQPFFYQGLIFLHCFAYEEAREHFQKAVSLDSSFVMAYWGLAMTYNHAYWQIQDIVSARNVLNQLASTPEERLDKCNTPIERIFIESLDILYGSGKKYDRDIAYCKFLEDKVEDENRHIEMSAFYALALLGSPHYDRKEMVYEQCAQLTEKMIPSAPQHPGLLHYSILSNETRGQVSDISLNADNFKRLAPYASHAKHLSSHIHLTLGKWADVIEANSHSWLASIENERANSDEDLKNYHALHWLQYALLQVGESKKANELLNRMTRFNAKRESKSSRSHLLAMKAAHIIELNQYDGESSEIDIYSGDLNLTDRAGHAYLEGLKAYHIGNTDKLDRWTDQLDAHRIRAKNFLVEDGFTMCLPVGYFNRPTTQLDIDMVRIMEDQLMAMRCMIRNDTKGAEDWLLTASRRENEIIYPLGPPIIFKPSDELLGEWYLQQDQPQKALKAFQRSLQLHQGRLLSLQGLLTSARLTNQEILIEEAEESLSLLNSSKIQSKMIDSITEFEVE